MSATRSIGLRGACDCALLALAALAAAAVCLEAPGALRVLAVFGAVCLVPGGAILTLLPDAPAPQTLGYGLGLGLAVEALGTLVMIWSGFWHPLAWSVSLAALACVLLAADLGRELAAARGPMKP